MTAVVNLDATLPKMATTRVVNVEERMPKVPAIAADPDLEFGFEVAIDDLKDSITRGRKVPALNTRAKRLTAVLTRVYEAKNSDDPMGSLVGYLAELDALAAEVRQVVNTVSEVVADSY